MKRLAMLLVLLAVTAVSTMVKPTLQSRAATAPHPSVTLSCTAPTTMPGGAFFNFYRGTTPGGESSTAINSAGQTTCGYVDTAVVVNVKYYYTAKTCAVSITDGVTIVCSIASNETSAVLPLLQSDLPAPTSLTSSAN